MWLNWAVMVQWTCEVSRINWGCGDGIVNMRVPDVQPHPDVEIIPWWSQISNHVALFSFPLLSLCCVYSEGGWKKTGTFQPFSKRKRDKSPLMQRPKYIFT